MRVRSITRPKNLGARRLDDLLSSRFAPQSLHGRLVRRESLSPALQYCIARLTPACAWRAYLTEEGIFCAMARAPVGDGGSLTEELEVYLADQNACVYSAGLWTRDTAHGWWLNSVLPLSYDCDHGWWVGALMSPDVAPGSTAATMVTGR
jgi:hypothetical protein